MSIQRKIKALPKPTIFNGTRALMISYVGNGTLKGIPITDTGTAYVSLKPMEVYILLARVFYQLKMEMEYQSISRALWSEWQITRYWCIIWYKSSW